METAVRQDDLTPTEKRTFAAKIAELRFGAVHRVAATVPILTTAPFKPTPVLPPPVLKSVPAPARVQQALPELPNSVRIKAADLQRRLHLLVAHVNRTLPAGCHVLAWSILPKEVFDSELGRFLMMACDFHASGPENTLLLPAMPAGMQHLNLPRHPLSTPDAQIADATQRVGQLRQSVTADHDRTLKALRNGDLSQMFQSAERQLRYRQELAKIAHCIAETAFGPSIWQEHENRFRKLLQSL